jgi:hypothetical protein
MRALSAQGAEARRATLLLAHGANVQAGAKARQHFHQSC